MARTAHHTGRKHDIKAPRNPEGYSGTPFVGCWAQNGRAYVKRAEHRMIRRHGNKLIRQEVAAMVEVAPIDTRSRFIKQMGRDIKKMMDELFGSL